MRIAGSTLLAVLGAGIVAVTGCASEAPAIPDDVTQENNDTSVTTPTTPSGTTEPRSPAFSLPANAPVTQAATMSINYQGGPVMLGTPEVYFIWYGDWAGSAALTVLPDFMSNI